MAFLHVKDIKVHIQVWNEAAEQTVVMLHGFTGSTNTWDTVARMLPSFRIIAIDCIGHGRTESPVDASLYEMDNQVDVLEEVCRRLQLESFSLVGYSMGGRIALSYAVKYPDRVEKLILESASPGLVSDEERMTRGRADNLLGDKIEENGVESFVDAWENIPLFASQKRLPEDVRLEIRKERLQQSARGLANSLRGMGTGMMPPLWGDLAELSMPVLLITGQLDEKFVNIAREMMTYLKKGRHLTVNDVGHAIHVENPAEFATIIKDTILSYF